MRKFSASAYYIFALLVIAVFVLSGCSQAVPENADKIRSPVIREVPFAGTWLLEKSPSDGAAAVAGDSVAAISGDSAPLEGDTVGFSQNALMFENKLYKDIRYKAKRVNVNAYFLHKKTGIPENLDRNNREITVTTVYSEDNFLFEFIEDANGTKIAVIDDNYYVMTKISDEFSDELKTAVNEDEQDPLDDSRIRNQSLRSGILLGVRIPVKTADGLGDYKYGTYWISSDNRSVRQVLYADDIYLPRMDGFWKLIVEKKPGPFGLEDTLSAYKVSNKGKIPGGSYQNVSDRIETMVRKAIVYVGNDYVCVENTTYVSHNDAVNGSGSAYAAADEPAASSGSVETAKADIAGSNDTAKAGTTNSTSTATAGAAGISEEMSPIPLTSGEKTLRTLPVDNLSSIDGIKISDMVGENGTMAMQNAISDVLKNSGYEGIVIFDEEVQEKNFALYRKTGHWFFKGRIDPDGQGQLPYMDFSLNLLPPSNMVAYDVLHVPWTDMKDKLPHAIDIYTSPNKDIAVILTRSEILVYTIQGRRLSEQPAARLRLEEGSAVIMAEWGMGDYVTSWEKSFVRNNTTKVAENLLDPVTDQPNVPSE
jgi:hypothetical protein